MKYRRIPSLPCAVYNWELMIILECCPFERRGLATWAIEGHLGPLCGACERAGPAGPLRRAIGPLTGLRRLIHLIWGEWGPSKGTRGPFEGLWAQDAPVYTQIFRVCCRILRVSEHRMSRRGVKRRRSARRITGIPKEEKKVVKADEVIVGMETYVQTAPRKIALFLNCPREKLQPP